MLKTAFEDGVREMVEAVAAPSACGVAEAWQASEFLCNPTALIFVMLKVTKIIFLHIPKTAGTSVKEWLYAHYSEARWLPAHLVPKQLEFSVDSLNTHDIFWGHLDWQGLDCVMGSRFVFTFLRRPLDRIISNFCYWKKLADSKTKEELVNDDLAHLADLKDYGSMAEYFLESKERVKKIVEYTFNNMYTYYFAFRRFGGPELSPRISSERVLHNALANLSTLNFVGLTETLEGSAEMLGCSLCLPRKPVARVNSSLAHDLEEMVRGEALSNPRLRDRLDEFTALDNTLYDSMTERFKKQAHEHSRECKRCEALPFVQA